MQRLSASEPFRVLFLGDSLTAGYGLAEEEAYPALIEKLAKSEGFTLQTRNGGVSGNTSAGALRSINWLLKESYDLVVISIGANDGLRGLPLSELEKNLESIINQITSKLPSARLMLAGIKLPLNFGAEYSSEFEAVFERVAKKNKISFLPFLLEGVAGNPSLNLPDRVHPNAEGHKIMANQVWSAIKPLVRKKL